MTFQPPPNQGNPPAPPPGPGQPGQFGPPPGGGYPAPGGSGGKAAFDPKTVNPLDWGILAAGALAFIFSLFDYYTATVSFSGVTESSSESAFGDGFLGWLAALLALAGAIVVALSLFASHVKMPAAPRLIALGLFAVAFLCSLITLFINPTDVPDSYFGHGFGYWASFILIIIATVLSLMRFQQTGGVLPGNLGAKMPNIGNRGPQGGVHGGQQNPGSYPPGGSQPGGYPPAGNAPGGYPPAGSPPPPPPPPGYSPPPPGQ